MQEKELLVKGKKMFYRSAGEGPAVVVLVHGFGEDGRVWDDLAAAFPQYHLIIPDLPGSGGSEMAADMSMEGLASILREVIVHETATVFYKQGEPGSVAMIGHSMGGYITLAFAEKYGEMLKAFGLFHSSAFADSDEKKDTRRKGIRFIEQNGAFEFLKTATPNLYSPETKENKPALVETQVRAGKDFSSEALIAYYEAMMARPDRTSVLKSTQLPVLFLLGKYDTAVPLADGLKQCYLPALSHLHILEHAGHMGMQEEPERSRQALGHFLQFVFGV